MLSSPGCVFCCHCEGACFFAVAFFCCRPGARFFSCHCQGAFFLAVVPGARFFCCRPRGAFFFAAVIVRARVSFAVVAGARAFFAVIVRARFFFAVVAGGALFSCRAGVHSLTGFLGWRTDNKNQHKATTAKKHRFLLLLLLLLWFVAAWPRGRGPPRGPWPRAAWLHAAWPRDGGTNNASAVSRSERSFCIATNCRCASDKAFTAPLQQNKGTGFGAQKNSDTVRPCRVNQLTLMTPGF